ncbi:TPA: hypothetical protein ACN7DQ_005160 [Klebsiella pneumoniae]
MKFYYLDKPGVDADGSACAVYLRFDDDTYTDDIDYAKRFITRKAAEKYCESHGIDALVRFFCDDFSIGTKQEEACQFVRKMGKGFRKHFVFDEFTLIKDVKQLRNALYAVGMYTQKEYRCKMVTRDTAYVERIK